MAVFSFDRSVNGRDIRVTCDPSQSRRNDAALKINEPTLCQGMTPLYRRAAAFSGLGSLSSTVYLHIISRFYTQRYGLKRISTKLQRLEFGMSAPEPSTWGPSSIDQVMSAPVVWSPRGASTRDRLVS